jgi:type VI secretion system Hcp family effector
MLPCGCSASCANHHHQPAVVTAKNVVQNWLLNVPVIRCAGRLPSSSARPGLQRRIAMPAKVLMTMDLQTQGKLRGPSSGSGTTGAMEIFNFSLGAANPVTIGSGSAGRGGGKADLGPLTSAMGSGTPSSGAQRRPIRIVKEVDSASPKLYQALVTNEVIKSATFQFFPPSIGGKETVAERITLTNAVISRIEYAPPIKGRRCEAVTLIYQELAVNGAKVVHIPLSLLNRG